MRYFNTEGSCMPEEHYMVCLDDRLMKIKNLYVDRKKYFVINKGRQYGKTTTLKALEKFLKDNYIVISLDFQEISSEGFADTAAFVKVFLQMLIDNFPIIPTNEREDIFSIFTEFSENSSDKNLMNLFICLSRMCAKASKPVVLMIDEVDNASNNQVFVDFLAMLRSYYLKREKVATFHSVILAGVYNIKNLKLKLRPDEEHQYNSPWNIAARFTIDMSFSAPQIAAMLDEYETEHHTGMHIEAVANEIYQYTSGYPYLVSAICKYMDEEIAADSSCNNISEMWTVTGVTEAVKMLLKENIPLFDSMIKQMDAYKDMRRLIEQIIYRGRQISFSPAEKSMNLGSMFGFLKEDNGYVAIANRIFEMYLLNLFISEESVNSAIFLYGQDNKNLFISDSRLKMDLVLEKFVEYFTDIYSENDMKFMEDYGRKLFLIYLKPIINGTGNYYLEAQTRNARRTDVIVDYLGEQFIIELKIWHGTEYNERGEKQLLDYLDYYHKDKGYMLSFNFNKKKTVGIQEIKIGDKTIVEAVV